IMGAQDPTQWPNGGNLTAVKSPNSPMPRPANPNDFDRNLRDTCAPDVAAVESKVSVANFYEIVDANTVYAWATTSISGLASPRLYNTYVSSTLLQPNGSGGTVTTYPEASAGASWTATLTTPTPLGPEDAQATQHGVISGCLGTSQPHWVTPPPPATPLTTITTSPGGIPLYVDTKLKYTPVRFAWPPNSTHGLDAQDVAGYQFVGWDDGSTSRVRSIRAPSTTVDTKYTAIYNSHLVTSSPAGLTVVVDGVACVTPCPRNWGQGTVHTISAVTPQGSGTRYVFANWSDGGAAAHTVTATSSFTTYTATFATQYLLTTAVTGSGSVQVTPYSVDGYYPAG
ncbi:MAG: hypothetical protein JNL98_41695, partial [Bryobacterales bacterium]|nr:hypothetical protein [Bryobacterales bacterium]